MIFKAEPNLFVRISNKYVQRVTGKKVFYFNDKGEFETNNEILIKVLSQNFESIKEEDNAVPTPEVDTGEEIKTSANKICKHCGMSHEKNVDYAVCARKHKKE